MSTKNSACLVAHTAHGKSRAHIEVYNVPDTAVDSIILLLYTNTHDNTRCGVLGCARQVPYAQRTDPAVVPGWEIEWNLVPGTGTAFDVLLYSADYIALRQHA